MSLCEAATIPTKIIPGIYEIVGGKINVSRIRNVAIEDLLGREPVQLDEDAISTVVRGRVVMVTGAGGSIGAELCRQVCRFGPAAVVLVEQAENNLFQIHRELSERHPEMVIHPCIADICDRPRIDGLFSLHRPSVVLHAAAHKHVPMMEWNPGEAVKNNVFGTRTLADLAHTYGVGEFVMISTDKAVNPTSTMGVCKRIAELYIQALSQQSETRFVTVRFGNVLGSTGSVIPIFQEQISRGGPVTVTHPEMKRYFMTIPEACQLVLQAATMGQGGEIFILDMGSPVEILELARDLIRLSGLRPDEDIEIRFTGMRPGEKLFEELVVAEENADKTRHPKIFVGRLTPHPLEEVKTQLTELCELVDSADVARIRAKLSAIVPEYTPFQKANATPLAMAAAGGSRT
jgi:FlaA1/EpsC-like NDP-sugar epimerase